MFGLAELFGRTSTVWFGPNDRTFFCRIQNFFLYYIIIAFFKMATLDILSLAYVNKVIISVYTNGQKKQKNVILRKHQSLKMYTSGIFRLYMFLHVLFCLV